MEDNDKTISTVAKFDPLGGSHILSNIYIGDELVGSKRSTSTKITDDYPVLFNL